MVTKLTFRTSTHMRLDVVHASVHICDQREDILDALIPVAVGDDSLELLETIVELLDLGLNLLAVLIELCLELMVALRC